MTNDELLAELRKIETERGELEAENVVEAAKPDDHPLHGEFEWDDKVAGHKYRVEQARGLIKRVWIRVTTEKVKITSVAYVRDPEKESDEPGYRSVVQLRHEPDSARDAIVSEFARVGNHLRRVRDMAVGLGYGAEVDAIVEQIGELSARVATAKPPGGRAARGASA